MDDIKVESPDIRARLAVVKAAANSSAAIGNVAKDMADAAHSAMKIASGDDAEVIDISSIPRERLEVLAGALLSSIIGFRNDLAKVEEDCNRHLYSCTEMFYPQLKHFSYSVSVDYGNSLCSQVSVYIQNITPDMDGSEGGASS